MRVRSLLAGGAVTAGAVTAIMVLNGAAPAIAVDGEADLAEDWGQARIAAAPYGDDAVTVAASLEDLADDGACVYVRYRVSTIEAMDFVEFARNCGVGTILPMSEPLQLPDRIRSVEFQLCRDDRFRDDCGVPALAVLVEDE